MVVKSPGIRSFCSDRSRARRSAKKSDSFVSLAGGDNHRHLLPIIPENVTKAHRRPSGRETVGSTSEVVVVPCGANADPPSASIVHTHMREKVGRLNPATSYQVFSRIRIPTLGCAERLREKFSGIRPRSVQPLPVVPSWLNHPYLAKRRGKGPRTGGSLPQRASVASGAFLVPFLDPFPFPSRSRGISSPSFSTEGREGPSRPRGDSRGNVGACAIY